MKSPKLNTRRRRWLRNIIYLFIVLLILGAAYQQIGQWRDTVNYPPAGDLVDVGGRRLHLYCEGTGSPTIVAEAGGGDFSIVWHRVQAEVAKQTRFCSYDRAGYGWSDYSGKIPTRQQVSSDLYAALNGAGIEGPYIMVGHSLGGVYVRDFALQHPEQIAGIVLVDSSHDNQRLRMPEELRVRQEGAFKWMRRLAPICTAITLVGIPRTIRFWRLVTADMEAKSRSAYVVTRNRTSFCSTLGNEFLAFDNTMGQMGPPKSLGNVPMIVLSHGPGQSQRKPGAEQEWEETWLMLQAELAALSSDSEIRVIEDASHMIQVDRPDAVTDAILDLVAHTRPQDFGTLVR